MTAASVLSSLRSVASPEKAEHLKRFFKTSPGEYGEGDCFLGIPVPLVRDVAKAHAGTSFPELHVLLQSPWHEARLCALLILSLRVQKKKTTHGERTEVFRFYLEHTHSCNNWDLVDLTCPHIVGTYLLDKPRNILYALADGGNLWEQRIALVSTLAFIRNNDFGDTLALAERLMSHRHYLIHKAIGWMLREVGKRNRSVLTEFLQTHRLNLPRTALRYAIEHYPPEERKMWLQKG